VRAPDALMLDSAEILPAVKFRFTGTFPAHTTARFAIAAPAPGGRTMPTRRSGTVSLSLRASTAAAATSWAAVSARRSAPRSMRATEPGRLASARTISRPMCLRSTGRSANASAASSMSALLAAAASAFPVGMGSPNATQTGVGRRRGDFHRYLFPAKEKTEPQRPSTATGITGTPAPRAISSNPLRIAISWPVREIAPSGKTQTSSPRLSALTVFLSHCADGAGETRITPALLKIHFRRPLVSGPW